MTIVFITYAAGPEVRFDRDYYVGRHLPLVREAWKACGLLSAELYDPAEAGSSQVAVTALTFSADEDVERALTAPNTPALFADLANFTDGKPQLFRGTPL